MAISGPPLDGITTCSPRDSPWTAAVIWVSGFDNDLAMPTASSRAKSIATAPPARAERLTADSPWLSAAYGAATRIVIPGPPSTRTVCHPTPYLRAVAVAPDCATVVAAAQGRVELREIVLNPRRALSSDASRRPGPKSNR